MIVYDMMPEWDDPITVELDHGWFGDVPIPSPPLRNRRNNKPSPHNRGFYRNFANKTNVEYRIFKTNWTRSMIESVQNSIYRLLADGSLVERQLITHERVGILQYRMDVTITFADIALRHVFEDKVRRAGARIEVLN